MENVINFPCAGNGKFPIFSAQERMNGEKYSFTHAWQPLAATCSHFSSHRQPLAPTCGQSSGRQWPPAFYSHRQPLAATCSQSSGCQWPPVSASILFSAAATCSHSSGRKWPPGRQWPPAFSSHRQPLAATCSQSSGRQWPPVSASILFSAAATCSHLQPIEWPPVAARILFSSATTCSHLQPIEWPQVAARASGRKWPQVARSLFFHTFDFQMCFAPLRCALFRHHNFRKRSDVGVFCAFWLGNVVRAAMACNFSSLIWPHGSAPAALASLVFRPSRATNHWKNAVFCDFPTFSRTCIFFLLTLSLLWSSLFYSSLLWLFPPLLFICPYCRKFDF